ncbi:c-type cytochrome [Arenibaculum pallidiluteum]|uniref:c-type cytochrome n=1 Tax=Arenibaculum pallidiluteum TaxID=2812559 RepID=UPI001F3AFF59|nr:c-type cytochrome [Arenibaculum pallidiluteum]
MRTAIAMGLVLLAGAPAAGAPAPAGAEACTGCHAVRPGQNSAGSIPSLAGRSAGDITSAMLAFRTGKGDPTVMDRIAKGFDEAEIRAIADWIAGQR